VQKKLPRVLLAFLFLPSAAWPGENAGHWVTLPAEGQLVILGVSNRRLTREGEIESARDDAARKLLFYHGLTGKIRTAVSGSTGPGGMQGSTETSLEPLAAVDLPALREALRFNPEKDVMRNGGAVFVRFTCPAAGAKNLHYESSPLVNGQPPWIRRPPAIDGYITALGFAGPQRHVRETVNKSYENAAAALIAMQSALLETIDRDSPGREASSHIVETAEGLLTGFLALEMWIDPATKAVWTLAAAPKTDTRKQ
jgi:hypothetical protein